MDPSAELSAVLAEAVGRHGVPGAAAGVLVDGMTIIATHGVTNVEHSLPVEDATLFQVGSISKTVTSAAVMLLVESSQLRLADPLAAHLPMFGEATGLDAERIIIEHLLSHQSGFDGDHLLVDRSAHTIEDLRTARRLFEPGTGFSYSNAGFSVAAAVIEAVSGEPFEVFVRERLLRPLEMATACFCADDAITHGVAAPHFVMGDVTIVLRRAGWQPGWELERVDWGAGGLIASLAHLLSWSRFQLTGATADGTRLLSAEGLARLHTPVTRLDRERAVALDWVVRHTDGVTTVEHGGETAGYKSDLVVAPGAGVGVAVLTNAVSGGRVCRDVRRWALERFAGIRERDPEPDPSLTVDPAALAGRYLAPFAELTISPGGNPGTMTVSFAARRDVEGWKPPVGPTMRLGFAYSDHAVTLDAPEGNTLVPFGLGSNGLARWVLWDGRWSPRIS